MSRALVVLVLLAALLPAGGGATARPLAAQAHPTVFAAASLIDAFPKIGPHATYSFGGSNALAAQILQGAPADVFAAANTALPNGLHRDGLCSKPVVFTRNQLVVIVPHANPAGIHSVYDLRKRGVKIVIAAPGVPVGSYTLQVLRKLKLTSVLSNVVSRESDVREVLAKVALDEADAGFVYSTDARTVPTKVRAVKIPARGQPDVRYGICVVSGSPHRAAAHAFIERVLGKTGQRILTHCGFLARVEPKR